MGSSHLLRAFASDDPDRFAQLLGTAARPDQASAILEDIPDELAGDVIGRLAPEAARRLLNDLPDKVIAEWLESCTAEAGRRVLSRISRERAGTLVAGIRNRKVRRSLQRLIAYPAGTVGELVQLGAVSVKASDEVTVIGAEIQKHGGEPQAPVAIIDDNGQVSGVLDLAMFLQNRDEGAVAGDFRIPVAPVFAEAALASLSDRAEWNRLTSLPVVDYEQKLVGYVSRSAFEKAIGSARESGLVLSSGIELSRRFLEFMMHVFVLIFDRRRQG